MVGEAAGAAGAVGASGAATCACWNSSQCVLTAPDLARQTCLLLV